MAPENPNGKFSIGNFLKNLFRKPETPLPDNENVDLLVNKAISEIDNIIRDYVFRLTLVPILLEIYIAIDMQTLVIITHEKPFFVQNDNFTCRPTKTTTKDFVVTTTQDLTLTVEKRKEYLEKLWLRLQTANFTVCNPFKRMSGGCVLFTFITYTDLCEMKEHHPDMMMFTDC